MINLPCQPKDEKVDAASNSKYHSWSISTLTWFDSHRTDKKKVKSRFIGSIRIVKVLKILIIQKVFRLIETVGLRLWTACLTKTPTGT